MVSITPVTEPIWLGEGPHWSDEEQVLYFVDINGKTVNRFEPETRNLVRLKLNDTVNTVIPVRNHPGEFVVAYGRDITLLKWDGKSSKYTLRRLFRVDEGTENRFNDGKADTKGRFFIGTMHETKLNEGSLYKMADCKLTTEISPVSISNGMAWNKENTRMYYIDLPTGKVDLLDYDIETGQTSNRRTFFDFTENHVEGLPDGMTIDKDDNIWVACWNGSQVIQVSKDGELMRSVKLPVQFVSSVAWGGKDLSTLYVTTMYKGLTEEERKKQPLAGALFAIEGLGTAGYSAGNTVEVPRIEEWSLL